MQRVDLAGRRLLAVLLVCVGIFTVGGYLLKAQCIGVDNYNAKRDKALCSNDIQVLFWNRHLDQHRFPYIHGRLITHPDGSIDLTGGTVEYPVLTGLFAWFPALFVSSDGGYLRLSALLLAPFSFLTVFLLSRMVRWRALLYALAPPLIWYSFHNWDLLVVCATTAALYFWWRERFAWAGALLAIGGWLKFWPLLLVVPLALDLWHRKKRQSLWSAVGTFVWVSVLVNGYFIVRSPAGWWAPYAFQKARAADITANSIWYWGFSKPVATSTLNTVVPLLVLLGMVIACGYGWRRAQREGVFPFLQVCGAILAVFMVTNKAHSPQYALWLLPFFCLLRLRWGWWTAYMVFDLLMYVGLFRWYYALGTPAPDYGLPYEALILGIWGRATMLVLLFVVFLRAEPALEPVPARRSVPGERDVAREPAGHRSQ
ncbi:MAG: hypothetical protein QOG99_1360 [Frankiales bacterium]|nr:hypothetical protein [Frankiales bacterium]